MVTSIEEMKRESHNLPSSISKNNQYSEWEEVTNPAVIIFNRVGLIFCNIVDGGRGSIARVSCLGDIEIAGKCLSALHRQSIKKNQTGCNKKSTDG